jgi:hypothetical protein
MSRMTWAARAVAVAAATLSISISPVAQAQSNDRGRDILKAAIVSGDLSVLSRLSPSDKVLVQKAFQAELKVADNSGKSSSGTLSTAAAKAAGLASAAAASRCWYNYHYSEATAFGIHVGSAWMQLNWCGNGSVSPTTALILTEPRGRTASRPRPRVHPFGVSDGRSGLLSSSPGRRWNCQLQTVANSGAEQLA